MRGRWRSGRDSNPRYGFAVYSLSRRAPSTTRPPLRIPRKARALTRAGGLGKRRPACQSRPMLKPLLALAALAAAPALTAQTAPSPADATDGDWQPIPDDDVLVMTLQGGHQVVIRLAPRYAPAH